MNENAFGHILCKIVKIQLSNLIKTVLNLDTKKV